MLTLINYFLPQQLLCRLSDSVRGLVRRRESVTHYLDFLALLCEDCYRSLFPGSSLGRRSLALHTLALVLELLATSEPWSDVWREECTGKHAGALFYCLGDSYESNKELAATVLAAFPASALGFDVSHDRRIWEYERRKINEKKSISQLKSIFKA